MLETQVRQRDRAMAAGTAQYRPSPGTAPGTDPSWRPLPLLQPDHLAATGLLEVHGDTRLA